MPHFEVARDQIEVTDPITAPANFRSPWMVCIRSAQSEETRRITYTAFFKDGYTSSHRELMEGQYNAPALIVAFNVAHARCRDVTGEIADELVRDVR